MSLLNFPIKIPGVSSASNISSSVTNGISNTIQTKAGSLYDINGATGNILGDIAGILTGAQGPLAKARARADPLFAFTWDVNMPMINGNKLPTEFVEEVILSYPTFAVDHVERTGNMLYLAGKKTTDPIVVTFYEDQQLTVFNYLSQWYNSLEDAQGNRFPTSFYKKTISVYATDANGNQLASINIVGAWPNSLPPMKWIARTGRVEVQTQFIVDQVIIVMSAPGSLLGLGRSLIQNALGPYSGLATTAFNAMGGGKVLTTLANSVSSIL